MSGKDETKVIDLNISNINKNLSMNDLKRHLNEFDIVELNSMHDVTTGKHNSNAKIKIRVKQINESNIYKKLDKLNI